MVTRHNIFARCLTLSFQAIALSSFSSHFIFGTPLSMEFGLATLVVVIAIFNYSDPCIEQKKLTLSHDKSSNSIELVVQASERHDS